MAIVLVPGIGPPTPIMGFGAIQAARDLGLRVPQDVSVISFLVVNFAYYVE